MLTMSQSVDSQISNDQKQELLIAFGDRLNRSVSLARYTAARIGGAADWLLVVNTAEQLSDAVNRLWGMEIPFRVIGGGSNILVSDFGVRHWVILNKARQIDFDLDQKSPKVTAESGANFGFSREV